MSRGMAYYGATIMELLGLPTIQLFLAGGEEAQQHFRYFTKRHPKYLVIQNKKWGVGLLELPDTFAEYLKGKDKQATRTNRNRAIGRGFRHREFEASKYLEDMMGINRSASDRQGRPMHPDYLDELAVLRFFEAKGAINGVFDQQDRLRAYAYVPVFGEVFVFSRLLGHADDLEQGIMYLLVTEVVRGMIDRQRQAGSPRWGMYDTFFGAPSGLKYFKERLGFSPYKVEWRWRQQ